MIQAAYLSDDGVVCGRNFVVKSVDPVEFPLRFDGNSVVVLVVIFHGSSFVSARRNHKSKNLKYTKIAINIQTIIPLGDICNATKSKNVCIESLRFKFIQFDYKAICSSLVER